MRRSVKNLNFNQKKNNGCVRWVIPEESFAGVAVPEGDDPALTAGAQQRLLDGAVAHRGEPVTRALLRQEGGAHHARGQTHLHMRRSCWEQ